MGTVLLVAQILLVALVAGIVFYPLYSHRGQRAWRETGLEAGRRGLAERKERLYGSIVDLDFDRDSGKLSPEDHARMREEAMREVLALLAEERELEAGHGGARPAAAAGPTEPAADSGGEADAVDRMIEEYKRQRSLPVEVSKG